MVDVEGVPLLRRSVNGLAAQGVRRFVFLVNHMADIIQEAFGDGSAEGIEVTYIRDDGGFGTAGATRAAVDALEDDFLVVYGDLLFDIDVARFCAAARSAAGHGTLMLHPNDHPADSDLVSVSAGSGRTELITAIHRKPRPERELHRNLVNAGLYYLRKAALWDIDPSMDSPDWARDVFPAAVSRGVRYHGYRTIEYVKDVGTPDRIDRGRRDVVLGKLQRCSYRTPQPVVFFNWDSVMNRQIRGIFDPSGPELLPGAADAIARLNAAGVAAILLANQSAVVRGMTLRENLERVHAKLDHLLGRQNAYFNDHYCCINQPETGLAGEISEQKVTCGCRKSAEGMLERALQEHALSLEQSIMIGNRDVYIEAGRSAGCMTIRVPTNDSVANGVPVPPADRQALGLEEAVEMALSGLGWPELRP